MEFKKFYSFVNENVQRGQLKYAEDFADKLFSKYGIDVEFTKHFIERVNDPRNKPEITLDELIQLFKKTAEKFGKEFSNEYETLQVVVKDIVISNLDGSTDAVSKTNPKVEVKVIKPADVKNKKYIDGILIGAVVGLGGVILAEKQGWIVNVDKKNKIYGAIAGAILGGYYIYRFKK
jgi:hypothetical protein